jgi:hypothetical protein
MDIAAVGDRRWLRHYATGSHHETSRTSRNEPAAFRACAVLGEACVGTVRCGFRLARLLVRKAPARVHDPAPWCAKTCSRSTPPSSRASPRPCRRSCAMSSKVMLPAECFREALPYLLVRAAKRKLVAFSCSGRGFCPSCMGRRMAQRRRQLGRSHSAARGSAPSVCAHGAF